MCALKRGCCKRFYYYAPQHNRRGTQVNKAIIAENVHVGRHVVMGVGEEAPNVLKPNIYGFGLVTVGEKAVIPDGVTIGKNVCISGETS